MNDESMITSIKNHFVTLAANHALRLEGLPEKYPAWIIKTGDKVGVAVPYAGKKPFYADFSRAEIENLVTENYGPVLYLSLKNDEERDIKLQFANVCYDFIRAGDDGSLREEIAEHPEKWWQKWRCLLGDSAHSQQVHAVAGELMVWRYLLRHDLKPEWTGAKKKRIDFTAAYEAWEVKSTLRRSELTVTVHGQYQLAADDGKKLNLVFCRLEESAQGESVDMLADNLKNMGIAADALERELKSLGLREGSVGRNRRFRCLETRVYDVDSSFPAITAKSFADGRFPAGIVKLDYTIDLANLPYRNWQDM